MRRLWWATVALAVASGPLALPAGPALARDEPPTLPPMQVVVLVDESGSLSDEDVVREREAARTIAFSVLAPDSEVSVVGFGSSNAKGQSAVDVVCEPTVLNGEQDRDALGACIAKLERRQPGEGDDTDHAAALQQALSFVRAGDFNHKIVFLLTDGKLDVADSAAYGDDPQRRNAAARAEARATGDELAGEGAQVWPLGFGAVDQDALADFARGSSCTPAAGDPRAQVVSDSSKLTAAVAEAFSSAACVKFDPIDPEDLPKGGSTELRGTIPGIASEASILVYKKDKRVQVEYWAPGASKPAPEEGGTKFEFAGQSTELETIKISDPKPGEWTIKLSSADVAAEDVAATVVYQAAVRTYITASPPRPVPGQQVDVEMKVWARNQTITDTEALSALTFTAAMSGAGFSGGQKIALADADGDGTYNGTVTVPEKATGELTFTGQVTGIGIGGDTRVLNTRIQESTDIVQGSIRFDVNNAATHPGDDIPGQITVDNRTGAPKTLRFVIDDVSPGTTLTAEPALIQAAPGETSTPFTLTVGGSTPVGVSAATLRLVDDADPTAVVAERALSVQVTEPPTWLEKNRWYLLAAVVLLAIALLVLAIRLRSRNDAKKVRGITVQLFSAGTPSDDLTATDGNGKVLRFTVNEDYSGPNLQFASARDPEAYEIRRSGTGILFSAPGASRVALPLGARRPVRGSLSIVISDVGATGGLDDEPTRPTSYDPFHGAQATSAIPEQRTDYPPPQDPFHTDPFGAPADPFSSSATNSGNGSAPAPAPAPPTQAPGTFDDPYNPFR